MQEPAARVERGGFEADGGDGHDRSFRAVGECRLSEFESGNFAQPEFEHRFPEGGDLSPVGADGEQATIILDRDELDDFMGVSGEELLREDLAGAEGELRGRGRSFRGQGQFFLERVRRVERRTSEPKKSGQECVLHALLHRN